MLTSDRSVLHPAPPEYLGPRHVPGSTFSGTPFVRRSWEWNVCLFCPDLYPRRVGSGVSVSPVSSGSFLFPPLLLPVVFLS